MRDDRNYGDALPDPDPIYHRICWICKGCADFCEHEGKRYEVGETESTTALYEVSHQRIIGLTWDGSGDYLQIPIGAFSFSGINHFEFVDPNPPHEDRLTVFYGTRSQVLGHGEPTGEVVQVPRHALARYATQEWGGDMVFRKVQQTLDDRPCFCASPICADIERSGRWLEDHGTEEDYEHDHRMRVLWRLHPMWNPTSRIEIIKRQLATFEDVFYEEKEKQRAREEKDEEVMEAA